MRLIGWPSTWDPAEGLQPIETQEIDFHATAAELRALAIFFTEAAEKAENGAVFEKTVDLGDSKSTDTTPICISIHHGEL